MLLRASKWGTTLGYDVTKFEFPSHKQERKEVWEPSFASILPLNFRVIIRPYWPGLVHTPIKDIELSLWYQNQNVRGRKKLQKWQNLMSIQIQNNLKTLNHFSETTSRGGCTCAVSEIDILRNFKHWVSEKFAGNNVVMVIPGAICWHLTEVAHSAAEPNMRRNAHLGGVPFRRNFTVIVLWGCWWRPPRTRQNVI